MQKKHIKGFTLIEVMITVAIVAIVAAIAYPSYQDTVRKSRRADAKAALLEIAQLEERFFTVNNQYSSALTSTPGLGYTCYAASCSTRVLTRDGYYQLTVVLTNNNQSYTITSAPLTDKSQAQDTACGTFSLSNTGIKCVQNGSYCSNGADAARNAVATCW
jgi:type IV pilus assembly protein PilE